MKKNTKRKGADQNVKNDNADICEKDRIEVKTQEIKEIREIENII